MKVTTQIAFVILFLALTAANAPASDLIALPLAAQSQQSTTPADTVSNRTLDRLLTEFEQTPAASQLPYDSWTFTVHRYLGYAIVAATVTQVILGSRTWDARKAGREPSTKTAHKYLGYSTAGLSLVQSSLGFANYWQLRDKPSGKVKRTIHLGLSSLATAGFVTAAVIARNARHDINDGTAAKEGKTFDDLYSKHRTTGILSGVSVLLTVIVIEW
jgi:hypothetical protein